MGRGSADPPSWLRACTCAISAVFPGEFPGVIPGVADGEGAVVAVVADAGKGEGLRGRVCSGGGLSPVHACADTPLLCWLAHRTPEVEKRQRGADREREERMPAVENREGVIERSVIVIEGVSERNVNVIEGVIERNVNVIEGVIERSVNVIERVSERNVNVIEGVIERNVNVIEGVIERNVNVIEGVIERNVNVIEGVIERNVNVVEGVIETNVNVIEGVNERNVNTHRQPALVFDGFDPRGDLSVPMPQLPVTVLSSHPFHPHDSPFTPSVPPHPPCLTDSPQHTLIFDGFNPRGVSLSRTSPCPNWP
ncbi:unnamed protein product [Closterium sp. NIES-64]|nr:unnamed protein product [Closterium sp. NIES-64]